MAKEKSFRDYLAALPKKAITDIAQNGGEKKILSIPAVIAKLVDQHSDPVFLRSSVKGLPPLTQRVFRLIFLAGAEGAAQPALTAGFPKTSAESLSEQLNLLQNRFLIYGVKSVPFRYRVFREIREALREEVRREIADSLPKIKEGGRALSNGDALFRDLGLLLLFILQSPLKKTKQGKFNKKILEEAADRLEFRHTWSGVESAELPPAFRLMLAFLSWKGLADDRDGEVGGSRTGAAWLDIDPAQRAKEWYDFLLCDAEAEKTRFFLSALQAAGGAVEISALRECFFIDPADPKPLPGFLGRLFDGGLVDIAENGKEERGLRLSSRGAEIAGGSPPGPPLAKQVKVLPNFDILVPRELHGAGLKFLFSICRLEKSDTLLTLKISRESVVSGLNRGVAAKEVVKGLEALASGGVPQNVLFSLGEWLEAHGAVAFENHFILRVKRPEIHGKLKTVLSGTRFLKEDLPGIGFSIDAADYEEVYSLLTKLGFSPRPWIRERAPEEPAVRDGTLLEKFVENWEGDEAPILVPKEGPSPGNYLMGDDSKYGAELKALSRHDLIHVLNYAILMERGVEVELKSGGRKTQILPSRIAVDRPEPEVLGADVLSGEGREVKIDDIAKVRILP